MTYTGGIIVKWQRWESTQALIPGPRLNSEIGREARWWEWLGQASWKMLGRNLASVQTDKKVLVGVRKGKYGHP